MTPFAPALSSFSTALGSNSIASSAEDAVRHTDIVFVCVVLANQMGLSFLPRPAFLLYNGLLFALGVALLPTHAWAQENRSLAVNASVSRIDDTWSSTMVPTPPIGM